MSADAVSLVGVAAIGFASAFQPFTPVEAYLVGIVATSSAAPVPAGVVAALGQTAGKVAVLLATRGLLRGAWLRHIVDRQRAPARRSAWRDRLAAVVALLDRPRYAAALLFASGVAGIPPLLAATVYVARTPMSVPVFTALCLTGRTIRFVAVALAPTLVLPD
jgi:membrane protein YqaA with SNARE-associated domain